MSWLWRELNNPDIWGENKLYPKRWREAVGEGRSIHTLFVSPTLEPGNIITWPARVKQLPQLAVWTTISLSPHPYAIKPKHSCGHDQTWTTSLLCLMPSMAATKKETLSLLPLMSEQLWVMLYMAIQAINKSSVTWHMLNRINIMVIQIKFTSKYWTRVTRVPLDFMFGSGAEWPMDCLATGDWGTWLPTVMTTKDQQIGLNSLALVPWIIRWP